MAIVDTGPDWKGRWCQSLEHKVLFDVLRSRFFLVSVPPHHSSGNSAGASPLNDHRALGQWALQFPLDHKYPPVHSPSVPLIEDLQPLAFACWQIKRCGLKAGPRLYSDHHCRRSVRRKWLISQLALECAIVNGHNYLQPVSYETSQRSWYYSLQMLRPYFWEIGPYLKLKVIPLAGQ